MRVSEASNKKIRSRNKAPHVISVGSSMDQVGSVSNNMDESDGQEHVLNMDKETTANSVVDTSDQDRSGAGVILSLIHI